MLLAGWVPGTEIRLGRMREGENDHRPGWDITLSAPKSVSLEGLVIGDRRVIRAHDDAVRATLNWIEKDLLQTRGWDPMTRQRPRVAANGMIVAGFRHMTSRIGDPQLHTHCVLANMTRNAAGEWRSVEVTKIRRGEKLIGAYYRNELARRRRGARHGGDAEDDRTGAGVRARRLRSIVHGRVLGEAGGDPGVSEGARPPLQREERGDGGAPYAAGQEGDRPLPTGSAMARAGQGDGARRATGAHSGPTVRSTPRPESGWSSVEVPPPDLPANELRSLRRAPALPKLPKLPREGWAPSLGAGRAVAGAGGGGSGGGCARGGPCRGASDVDPGDRDPGGGAEPRAGALRPWRDRSRDRPAGHGAAS